MTPENVLAEWSRLLFESLADAGLRDVVVSPGSRSTPLVWAALASERLHARSVIDERSAGFFALGHARVTGRPVALLCTSGSAAANYFPAVVEASVANVPLLVVTADRPFELQDCGAPQTIDQIGLYGSYVRRFVEVGMPDAEGVALAALRRRAAQACFDATHPVPGPIHLNVRARKPLEPGPARSPEAAALTLRVNECLRTPITCPVAPRRIPPGDAIEALAASLGAAERGLIVCGPSGFRSASAKEALGRLARAAGFPLYAEATSQLRFDVPATLPDALCLDGLDLLYRVPEAQRRCAPDVVLQIGAAPTSSAWERLVAATPEMVRHVVTPWGWSDPENRARTLIVADEEETATALAATLERRGPVGAAQRAWAERLARANEVAEAAATETLTAAGFPSEGQAVRSIVEALSPRTLLALGNSLPVRHADAFCRARRGTGIDVWSQRGASGIDGVVSGAAGAADASGRPTVLVVGDVSALHDVGGFAVAAAARSPFVVVVLNNDGGRIFEQLPLRDAGLDERALAFWTTPHGRTFDAVAKLHGLSYARPGTRGELDLAVRRGLAQPGCTVVEVTCPPHGARDEYAAVAARVGLAVRSILPGEAG